MAEKPLVYLVLGAVGSGRREVVADLMDGSEPGQSRVIIAEGEHPDSENPNLGAVTRWLLNDDGTIDADIPEDANQIFFLVDGRKDPIDQIEAFKVWLSGQAAELGRILCVVHCQLAERNPPLLHWYDACIHFSDVVLLNRREGVPNKWVSDFKTRYKDQYLPCLIEFVKDGKVGNPGLILEPQALRISHAFDPEPEWVAVDESGEEQDEDDQEEGDEEVEMVEVVDPYFVKLNGGRREKEVPHIAKYLPSP